MTPSQAELVRDSWAQVLPIREAAADIFYSKLFELDPSLRTLFKGDIKLQGRKLMAMIDAAVRGLDHPDTLAPALKDLGRRHHGYGVTESDYGTVAIALLATLEQGLGPAFTVDVRNAWTEVYAVLAAAMRGY